MRLEKLLQQTVQDIMALATLGSSVLCIRADCLTLDYAMCGITCDPALLKPLFQGGGSAPQSFEGTIVEGHCCDECGYIRFPLPSQELLDRYFRTRWLREAKSWYTAEADYADWKRRPRADRILSLVSPFGFGLAAEFHEVGCGFGGTVFELQSRGITASGTDWNDQAILEGGDYGVHDISALPDGEFLSVRASRPNVVFGFQVLQRQREPAAYLAMLASHLAEEGIIVMILPNSMALFPLVYGYARYSWYTYPSHLHVFSAKSLQCLARAAGLEVLHIGSRLYDVAKEHTEAAIGARKDSDVARELRTHALETSLLGEELEVVLAPRRVTERFPEQLIIAAQKCEESGAFELKQRQRSEYVHLPDPWKAMP